MTKVFIFLVKNMHSGLNDIFTFYHLRSMHIGVHVDSVGKQKLDDSPSSCPGNLHSGTPVH